MYKDEDQCKYVSLMHLCDITSWPRLCTKVKQDSSVHIWVIVLNSLFDCWVKTKQHDQIWRIRDTNKSCTHSRFMRGTWDKVCSLSVVARETAQPAFH